MVKELKVDLDGVDVEIWLRSSRSRPSANDEGVISDKMSLGSCDPLVIKLGAWDLGGYCIVGGKWRKGKIGGLRPRSRGQDHAVNWRRQDSQWIYW